MHLTWIERSLAIIRLAADSPVPDWATRPGTFFSSVRTEGELSLVCERGLVPEGLRTEGPFLAVRVAGPLDFALVGVLASLLGPLAAAGISVFAISTYDTDYVLVREGERNKATAALVLAGHEVG